MANRQLAQRSGVPEPAEIIRQVLEEIKYFPALLPVVQKGLAAAENDNAPTGKIERILSADPIMVTRILRLANSAYFGVMAEVRTVSMAINVIGYRKLRSLLRHVLVSGLIELLSQGRPGTGRIRDAAVAVSAASHEIASRCQLEDPQELLVAGLLHNIGELALFWSFPMQYSRVLQLSATSMPLSGAQRAVFGVDSHEVGGRVLETWQFPLIFCQVVARWPDPSSEAADATLRLYLTIVSLAVVLVEALSLGSNPDSIEISQQTCETLQLPEGNVRQILAVLPEKIAMIRAMFED